MGQVGEETFGKHLQMTVKSKSHSRLQMFGWCFLILADFHLVIQSNEYIFSREWWGDAKLMTFRRINNRLWELRLCLLYLLSHLSIIFSLSLHSIVKEHIPPPPYTVLASNAVFLSFLLINQSVVG